MNLDDFNYSLPEELIAKHPLAQRDKARLLVVDRQTQTLQHDIFSNIDKYLPLKSSIVVNDSKVIPARLLTRRKQTGGVVELFLLKKSENGDLYHVLMRPKKRLKAGEELLFADGKLKATIISKEEGLVKFNKKDIKSFLQKYGHVPLPPYINREDNQEDREFYQTVYADREGSVAAPTAGLHFTDELLQKIQRQGHQIEKITLHVSYGTFKPVEEMDISKHQMHYEDYHVTTKTYEGIKNSKDQEKKIVAVGTTSCRVLETIAREGKLSGETNIFIYPGYDFKMADILITNFHLPCSTLLMLVYAFGGEGLMKKAYREAIEERYRFYSYGDAMIIL